MFGRFLFPRVIRMTNSAFCIPHSAFLQAGMTTLCFLLSAFNLFSQQPARPKLVVGVVVDQMRYDQLYRYQSQFGEDGFKRILREGFSCENTHYNYMPTYTGPGHATIYTGTTPSLNGIIGNTWWDADWRASRYVTEDKNYKTVGAPDGKSGWHSPAVLLSTTITDELRLSNNFRSKVVSVCLKDRGSILPAGHIPNACYWFDDATGNWITSTYYPDSMGLNAWVQNFNKARSIDAYLSKPWVPKMPITESIENWEAFKSNKYGDVTGAFPHDLPGLRKSGSNYGIIRTTPFGNSFTLDLAFEAIDNMQLGKDADPDFLCISFSATDYCGHQFGIHAAEMEDIYVRLDADFERLLNELDKKVGPGNYLLFVTSDHGGGETPSHMKTLRIPAGVYEESKAEAVLEGVLARELGVAADYIHEVANQQIWLNWEAMESLELDPNDVADVIIDFLQQQPGVFDAMTIEQMLMMPSDYPYAPEIRRGINNKRSGDMLYNLEPGWHSDDQLFGTGGAAHGSPYSYDTHVPLLWFGTQVPRGTTHAPVSVTDIAPTLAAMLRIMEPNASTGKVIEALFKR